MLQILRETTGRWVAVVILGLIAVTFVFFGVDFSLTGTTFAAKVNGQNIPILEFEQELQRTQNQYQQLYPVELTEELRRQLRRSVVDRMVLTKALEQRVQSAGYRISDARLSESIRSTAAFQVGGQFSIDAYSARLNSQGLSPSTYEVLQRRQLELLDLQEGIGESTFLTPAEYRRYIELFNERRAFSYALFSADSFLAQVEVDDSDVAEHFATYAQQYLSEETVDIEYVEIDQASLAGGVVVNDAVLEDYYVEQLERFETTEDRHARHILVTVDGDDYAAAEAEAQAIYARVQAGEDFAALAAELSDDAGTKAQGGDLGWIARGSLVGPFEDELYALEVGQVSEPVETEFGYHIIRLDELRAGDVQPFAAVRDELAAEYATIQAEELFYDAANRLEELAFNAYDELASVAAELDIPLHQLQGYPRRGNPDAFANNPPVVQAAFDDELIATGNNSRIIELADDRVLVLRVTAHNLPEQLPLDAVTDQIRNELARRRAEELVGAATTAFLADLESGAEDPTAAAEARGGVWNEQRWVQRTDADVPTEVLSAAFAAVAPLPGSGLREIVPLSSGDEAVLVLTAIEPGDPDAMAVAERDQRRNQLADETAQSELTGYAADVRDRSTVRIPDEVLNPQF
jgi:peptidyl-prolyl cis-trans isomerase D